MRHVTKLFPIWLLALAACDSVDRIAMTEFTPEPGGFEFRAVADAIYPADDPAAEAKRIQFLEKYLRDNAICTNGYRIVSRQQVLVQEGLIGEIVDIIYQGECA